MGVGGLKSFLMNDKFFKTAFVKKTPEKVSSLFIDANGIFYKALARVYKLGESEAERKKLLKVSKTKLTQDHIAEIINILENFIKDYQPEDNLIVAVDGVVNAAKMSQQKTKTFRENVRKR